VTARAAAAPALATSLAVQHCEHVARREARNFWYGIRLLPPDKRGALAAVYAMARRIDDIGDGQLGVAAKQAALNEVRCSLSSLDEPGKDLVLVALSEAQRAFSLPITAFYDLIEGVQMDLLGTRYESMDELVVYCRRVAGSIGRLSRAVFGTRAAESSEELDALADDLGVALQLTNILRDVREDLQAGRVYVPAEDLRRFGVEAAELGGRGGSPANVAELISYEAARAEDWFARGLELLPRLDRRSAACAGAMAGIYLRLLRHIAADPLQVTRRRLSLPAWEKAWVAGRALAGLRP
jgi:phytoene synthase